MRVLVTGRAGSIGSHVVEQFPATGTGSVRDAVEPIDGLNGSESERLFAFRTRTTPRERSAQTKASPRSG